VALVVDSCILLDVALKDPSFGVSSALFLEGRREAGLVVCPVSVVEISPHFGGASRNVQEFLRVLGAECAAPWLPADTEAAAVGWTRYVTLKRQGRADRRPVADILIGGFACRFGGLATRNPEHFAPFFPGLALLVPPAAACSPPP
jgi:predicted nucleic acid-binding protein